MTLRPIYLKEGNDDEFGTGYMIKSSVGNMDIKELGWITDKMWNYAEEFNTSSMIEADEVIKSLGYKFNVSDIEDKLNSLPTNWYEIFNLVLTHLDIDYKNDKNVTDLTVGVTVIEI